MYYLPARLHELDTISSAHTLISKFSFNNDNSDDSTHEQSLPETAAIMVPDAPVAPNNTPPPVEAPVIPPLVPGAAPPEAQALIEENFPNRDERDLSNGSDYSSHSDSDLESEVEVDGAGEAADLNADVNHEGDLNPNDFAGEHNLAHQLADVEMNDGAVADLGIHQNDVAPDNNLAVEAQDFLNLPAEPRFNARAALGDVMSVLVGISVMTTIGLAAGGIFDSDGGDSGGHAHATPPLPVARHATETEPAAGAASEPSAIPLRLASLSLEFVFSGPSFGAAAVPEIGAQSLASMGDSAASWMDQPVPGLAFELGDFSVVSLGSGQIVTRAPMQVDTPDATVRNLSIPDVERLIAQLRAYQLDNGNCAAPEWTAAFQGLDIIAGEFKPIGVAPVMWVG